MNLLQIQKRAKQHEAKFIDVKFCDLAGGMHHITLPIKTLDKELFQWGVGVDGSSLPGYTPIERGDMILLPDPATVFLEPFCSQPTISFLGDIMDAGDKIGHYSRNPRRVAKAAEASLEKMFAGAAAMMGKIVDRTNGPRRVSRAASGFRASTAGWLRPPHAAPQRSHQRQ